MRIASIIKLSHDEIETINRAQDILFKISQTIEYDQTNGFTYSDDLISELGTAIDNISDAMEELIGDRWSEGTWRDYKES